jgi:hypothetical protein
MNRPNDGNENYAKEALIRWEKRSHFIGKNFNECIQLIIDLQHWGDPVFSLFGKRRSPKC